jgi:hypothetical protein
MWIACHANTKLPNLLAPSFDEQGKRAVVVLRLHAPHRLLI